MKKLSLPWSRSLILAGVSSFLLVGCTQPIPDDVTRSGERFDTGFEIVDEPRDTFPVDEPMFPDDPFEYVVNELDIVNPALKTTMGPVTVSDHALRVDSFEETWGTNDMYTSVTTTAPDADSGAAMVNLSFSGGLSHPAFVPGARLTFNMFEGGANGLQVDAIGCSGPSEGQWSDFDTPAEEVDIEIEEGEEPGTQVLNYRATFFDYDGQKTMADGSFTYTP